MYILHFAGGPRAAAADCGPVHLAPGSVFPGHRHRDIELAMLLQGELRDDSGQVFQVGDPCVQAPGSVHRLWVCGDTAVLLAVVSYGELDFL